MYDRQVRDEIMTIFIAGHETTVNPLIWIFYLFLKTLILGKTSG
jgi:cytochrome P450